MQNDIENIKKEALLLVEKAQNSNDIQDVKSKYLAKKSDLSSLLKQLGKLSPEERPKMGALVNEAKKEISDALAVKEKAFRDAEQAKKLNAEKIDITMPGKKITVGKKHPMTLVLEEITEIFKGLGYSVAEGPEIETDFYNFEALNIPEDHPSREMHDTFYLEQDEYVLRTHTSPVQVRSMLKTKPPIKIIAPGRVFRKDADASHSPVFHQIEGLYVDEGITFADLKGTLDHFIKKLFGDKEIRLRPSYFPFTEPSAEVDVQCVMCNGDGCRLCKGTGWIEILGAGMVDPNVYDSVKYDKNKYTGFAFGMGLERITMLKYGIDNIKLFFDNDVRFLNQF